MDSTNFCKTLKLLRKICDKSAKETAKSIGIPEDKYLLMEQGSIMPDEKELEKISEYYNTVTDKLLDGETTKNIVRDPALGSDKLKYLSLEEKILFVFVREINPLIYCKMNDYFASAFFELSDEKAVDSSINLNSKLKTPVNLSADESRLLKMFRLSEDKNIFFDYFNADQYERFWENI